MDDPSIFPMREWMAKVMEETIPKIFSSTSRLACFVCRQLCCCRVQITYVASFRKLLSQSHLPETPQKLSGYHK